MTWPPTPEQVLNDFISSPGDALCGITVSSCAPANTPNSAFVPADAPSPYAARGPVAYGVTKPDLSVPEGNLMPDGSRIGQPTMKPDGEIRTDLIGTSFAAPIVSGAGAEIFSCLSQSNLPISYQLLITKAMLLHHAKIPVVFGSGRRFRPNDYYGYGKLGAINDMLEDPSWRSTSLILADLYPDSGDLVIDEFPYPDSLRVGDKFRGKILVTMASEPILDPSFKVEYARSNVDVHLSVMKTGKDGKVHAEPASKVFQPASDYETSLIREQHKWSPIKQYDSLGEVSCKGDFWQLRAHLSLRDVEYARYKDNPARFAAEYYVPVVIAVTIEDPSHTVNVNNEMVTKWKARGFVTEEIAVTSRVRSRLDAQ